MLKKLSIIMCVLLVGLMMFSCSEDSKNSVEAPANIFPANGIYAPSEDAEFVKGTPITVTSIASDSDGFVTNVVFYFDGDSIGVVETSPYTLSVPTDSYETGAHMITTIAIDNEHGYQQSTVAIKLTDPVPTTVTDYDGNVYSTVRIGSQVWMVENLKTTHYRNGDLIQEVTDNDEWIGMEEGAVCDYNNEADSSAVYGKLYNQYAVNDDRKICPDGWHIPSRDEFSTMIDYLGGSDVAGGKLKEAGSSHWHYYVGTNEGTNESGFTALPGGSRTASGQFSMANAKANFWTSYSYVNSMNDKLYGYYRSIGLSSNEMPDEHYAYSYLGMSVRCIKDAK